MSTYDLVADFLLNGVVFRCEPVSGKSRNVYSYKINGNTRFISLNNGANTRDELGRYNAHLFIERNLNKTTSYDFHGCLSVKLTEILDAILDYHYQLGTERLVWITGNGRVIKPIVARYLKRYDMWFREENNGSVSVRLG